jgi:hypothetical protein
MAKNQDEIEENTLPEPPTDEAARAYLNPTEPVGNDGSRAMISASYMILPHE